MRPNGCLHRFLAVLLLAVPLASQNLNLKHPEDLSAQKPTSPEEMRDRASRVRLQKDAKELADLCNSVPADMDTVKQGAIPEDLLEKLKRLEKLSKRVREELTRTSSAP
jgi:hypothetical protein